MSFAWFVALRYLLDARGQTTLILSAVSVGVAVVVFLSALITGLQASLVDKTLGAQAHVTLRVPREAPRALVEASLGHAVARVVQPAPQRLRSIEGWPAVMADAERTAGVTAVSPMVVGAGFAVRSDAKQAVVLLGVIPERHRAIVDVERHLDAGRLDVTGARAVVGSSLARDLAVTIGDKIHVTTTEGVSDVLTVAGIFTLGNQGVDRTWVITSLRQAQALYRLPGGATTLELKVADVFDAERVAIDLHGRTGLDADSWMTLNAALLSGLSAQSSSRALIEFFIVIAVALGIASVLAVSVVQKSREIGILRAVGTPARRVLAVFLIQGGVLGLLGAVVGGGLGALLARFFQSVARGPDGAPQFPMRLDASLLGSALVMSTVVGLLAAVLPARRAARIDPAVAIRLG